MIKFVCFYCGKEYAVDYGVGNNRIKHNQSGMFFCTKECQGKWLGETHGLKPTAVKECLGELGYQHWTEKPQ